MGEMNTDQKLLDQLEENEFLSPKKMINKIVSSVRTFEDGFESFDDITAPGLHYKGNITNNTEESI